MLLRRGGWSRVWFHVIPGVTLLLLQVLLIFFAEHVMILVSIVSAFMFGAFWSITAAFVSEEFGEKWFGSNWGVLMLGPAASGLVFQLVSGFIYDRNVQPGSSTCTGASCYQMSFVFCAGMLVLALPLAVLLLRRSRKPRWAALVAVDGDKDRLMVDVATAEDDDGEKERGDGSSSALHLD
jgi:MFS family permease